MINTDRRIIEIPVTMEMADEMMQAAYEVYEDVADYEFIDNEHVFTLDNGDAVVIPSVIVLDVRRTLGLD